MQRWALLLSAHQYDIKYRKSGLHGNADGLSRLPLPVADAEPTQAEIFYLKDVTAAPVTSAHVKKHTHTDPVMYEVLGMVICGRGGKMSPRLKHYLVRKNKLSVQS